MALKCCKRAVDNVCAWKENPENFPKISQSGINNNNDNNNNVIYPWLYLWCWAN